MFMSRQDSLEKAFMKHIDKEEESFKHLITTLENIKEEIHKTNTQMAQFNSTQELRLLETKADILNTVFTKVVEKEEYSREYESHNTDILQLKTDLKDKVDKGTVKLLWIVMTSAIAFIAWVVDM